MPLNTPIRDWQDKRVWLVGASCGIGAALAEALAQRGAQLALSGRRPERLRAVASRIPGSTAIPLDLSRANSLLPALLQLLDQWGGVDVVVFNAGSAEPLSAVDLAVEGARIAFEINLIGVVNGVAAVLPQLLQQGAGAIVIIGSAAGYRGQPSALAFGASKAGVINFAEGLYWELVPRGIGVFLATPGFYGARERGSARISAIEAARRILDGIARGRFEISFPRRRILSMRWIRLLPERVSMRVLGWFARA